MVEFDQVSKPVRGVREAAERGDFDELVTKLVAVAPKLGNVRTPARLQMAEIVAGLPESLRVPVILEVFERAQAIADLDERDVVLDKINVMVERLAKAAPSADEARAVLGLAARHVVWLPGDPLVAFAEVLVRAGEAVPDEAVAVMRRSAQPDLGHDTKALRTLLAGLDAPPVNPGEEWADAALAELPALGERWRALVAHAATATSAKPSPKWDQRAQDLLDGVDAAVAGRTLRGWFAHVGRPRTMPLHRRRYDTDINDAFDPVNATVLRGLVWLAAMLPEDGATARAVGALVDVALHKVPGRGPRNPKVANAAVHALSRMPGDAALAQLARLAARVTFKGTLKELHAALEARATALGLTRDELEELAVPAYGLSEVGRRVDAFGPASAELVVSGRSTTIAWRDAAGKAVKAPPAVVRAEHAEELKEFKAAVNDVEQMLSAQAERLDRQFLARRVWPAAAWRERYLDHPLVGTLARRLIWLVDERPAAFADGALRGLDDKPVDGGEVRLWHPIGRDAGEVLAWREWLERHGITQPFKQAHREVYVLTVAEEQTRVYSNRFAAHILRQHQFHALAAVRGWHNRLRFMVDDSVPAATRVLPRWDLRAEFWVEGVGDDHETDTAESGAYLRVATDQVRFYRADEPEPLPLSEVPPLVFSEVMRDVDLFVGVASVGNDPTWQDGGPGGRFQRYWEAYSFGELSASAQTRRELLARLIPRLAIADRASLDGRFLIVRGDLHTYKIHLGSSNILISPANRYLCILARQAPNRGDPLFLPFEGDGMLPVILSKAFLLANDTQITDPTITSQLG
jgi:hypothetical protein